MTSASYLPNNDWFKDLRFGMFIHYGPYSHVGRGEWLMAQEGWTREEYEKEADHMVTHPENIRAWVRLAKAAGMRYAVFTTKHHDGFSLWDSTANEFNSVRRGPKLDLVKEFVEACRMEGLRVGLYYSLADWQHPDGAICATDLAARSRFLQYTRACVAELLANYGKIDILWFDGPWPLGGPENWNASEMVSTIRQLQPEILINDRLGEGFQGDFSTSERSIDPGKGLWEACMTMNDDWGFTPRTAEEWVTVKDIALMLRKCSCGGNLLLNIGPMANGEIPDEAKARLEAIGRWLEIHAPAVFPQSKPLGSQLPFISNTGYWTLNGNVAYYWLARAWPGTELHLGGIQGELLGARLLGHPAQLTLHKHPLRWTIKGLPETNPDPHAKLPILELTFSSPPAQKFPYPHVEFTWET